MKLIKNPGKELQRLFPSGVESFNGSGSNYYQFNTSYSSNRKEITTGEFSNKLYPDLYDYYILTKKGKLK